MCSVSARMVGTSRGWQAICLSHSVSGRSLTSARAYLYTISLSFALSSMAIGFPFSMTNFQDGVFQEYIMPALTKLVCITLAKVLWIKASHKATTPVNIGGTSIRLFIPVVWFIGDHQFNSSLLLQSSRGKDQIQSARSPITNS